MDEPKAGAQRPGRNEMENVMKRVLITAVLATATALPAVAADSTSRAIELLNRSADTQAERIAVGPNGPVMGTTASTRGNDALYEAVRIRNRSAETASDRIDPENLTVFSGEPAYGAQIFEELRRADDSD